LEFPSRYGHLEDVAGVVGMTSGALKAHFRRRELPSPFAYTIRPRALCVSELLSWPGMTTARVAHRLGYSSNDNLCRAFRALTGISLSQAATLEGRLRVLTWMHSEMLTPDYLRQWEALGPFFVRTA
jgi:AraC-like DNA-binding protein